MRFESTTCLFLVMTFLIFCCPGVSAQTVGQSTLEDQTAVEVTVYNSNLGLVKDMRTIPLEAGEGELRFMDVASSIMPMTVHVRSVNHPGDLTVLEQNYEYDLMNPSRLLDKYVGKEIKIREHNEFTNKTRIKNATLLSNNDGEVYRINHEIYLGHPGIKILPEIPENLIARPTLTWLYKVPRKETHQVEVSYLTGGINWRADYVVVLDAKDEMLDLSGWVTLDNNSGAAYRKARLKLVAGDINRVYDARSEMAPRAVMMKAQGDYGAGGFEEKAFYEYHLYDLQRPTTIKDKQSKQISLLEASGVKAEKEFLVHGIQGYFFRQFMPQEEKQPVNVYVKFQNAKDNRLGMPLPAGIMRLYKKDDAESLQFVGEDRIDHTPKDEEVKLKIGEAFDITAKRIQKDYKRIANGVHESEWEITLKNHKQEDITVGVVEPLYGSWEVLNTSHPYEKSDAFTLKFSAPVPKDGETKVNYRIRVSTDT